MKKIVIGIAIVGFLIALCFGGLSIYDYHHGERSGGSPVLSYVVLCLWPTGLTLIETSDNTAGYVFFLISAILNGLLYGLLAFCIATIYKVAVDWRNPDDGYWPHDPGV